MKIINLGVLAHVDAGKTTVTEGLLVHSGVKRHMGRVDDGTTTTDSMALERQRGMTIRAATVSFCWQGTKINLIDTPGHMDFIAEVDRSLAVLDGVILVVSAREGVQPQTRVIFEKLRAMRIPTILFINKIDRTGVTLPAVYEDIRTRLTPSILPMQDAQHAGTRDVAVLPRDYEDAGFREPVISLDDRLLTRFCEGKPIGQDDIWAALKRQTRALALCPVYLGAALHDIGIPPLMDAITTFFGQPPAKPSATLSAYIYKVEWDAHDHKWAYLRVFEGTLSIRSQVPHVGHEEPVYVRGLRGTREGGFWPAGAIEAGDIGVLLDTPHVRCGDFLGTEIPLPGGLSSSQPLLAVGIEPDPSISRHTLLNALQRLTEEDPNLQLSIHPETEEITLRLYGVLQREIIASLLEERFGIQATFTPLKTLLMAQPIEPVTAEIRIFRDGNTHQAGIRLTLEPLPAGSGVVYERAVSYGDLERPFQNAVEEGALLGLRAGLGDEIVDTKVSFTDMDYSSVTSTPADYRRLAPLVVARALQAATLRKMEPWLRFEINAPAAFHKKVLAAVSHLRAVLGDVTYTDTDCVIRGEAPLDTTKEFPATLQSLTQGQGIFSMEFLEYREI